MDLVHEFQKNSHFNQSVILPPQQTPYNPSDDESSQATLSTPKYISGLIERLLEHDPRRKIIERVLYRFFTENLFGSKYVKLFLMGLYRQNCRYNTLRAYNETLPMFIRFLQNAGHTCFKTVKREDLAAFIEHEQDRRLKPTTVLTRLNHIWAFMRFLANKSVIHSDILKRKIRIKVPESLPRAIDPEDVRKLIAPIKKPRDRALILLLLRTGMRIGELLNTRISDINLKEKSIDIYEAQKNRVGRVVFFSADALRALNKWIKKRDPEQAYLFYGKSGNPISYETARQMYMSYIEKTGLTDKGYTLHSLRHTFASELLNAGMRLECLQPLLGHKSIEVTRIYARLTDNTRKKEYFKAMSIIEKGETHGHYRLDSPIPKMPKKTKLLSPYDKKLYE